MSEQDEYCMMCQHLLSEASSCTHPHCENKQDEMPDNKCLICGGDQDIAKMARRMGYRPDIAFAAVIKAEAKAKQDKLDLLEKVRCMIIDYYPEFNVVTNTILIEIDHIEQEIEGE